jgi:uncharacterized protein YbbK (DUF523 family)
MDLRGSGAIRIGVSACLLGQEVRFDGGHKRSDFLTGTLGDFVEFVAVCPEVDIGLGIPRESLRLVRGDDGAVRMVANKSGADVTETMNAYAERRTAALEREDLSGYVLKKDSPSSARAMVPLVVPLTLIRHWVRRFDIAFSRARPILNRIRAS